MSLMKLTIFAAVSCLAAFGCNTIRVTYPVPSLVANAAPAASQYPSGTVLPLHSINAEEWSWITGAVRAQSAFAGHITGTTVCDLHGGRTTVDKAEVENLKNYFHSVWKEPAAPPAGGALLIAPSKKATGQDLESFSFSCEGTPHFTVNGVSVKPDFVFEVQEPSSSNTSMTLEAVTLQDGNVLGIYVTIPVDPQTHTAKGTLSSSYVFAGNIKPYMNSPIGAAYLEGVLGASDSVAFLVEENTTPPSGLFVGSDFTSHTVRIARFVQK